MKKFFLPLVIVASAVFVSAQHLPNLPDKPAMQFESHSFCPPEGSTGGHGDPELNRHKNRIDASANYFAVDFAEIASLAFPQGVAGTLRSDWSASDRKAVEKDEGIPIVVEGFLAIVNNAHQGKPKLLQGARPESGESCNCGSIKPSQVDFHIWLTSKPNNVRTNAIVVEMTPRVRAHHPTWTVNRLTTLAKNKTLVRISGWLMLDGQHPEQIAKTRGSLWEIHPIMKVEFKQGTTFKTL